MALNFVVRVIILVSLLGANILAVQAQGPVNYADWHLEWAEEFNAPVDTVKLAERWRFFYPWGHAINPSIETGYYTSQGLEASGGALNMTMHKLAEPRMYRGKAMHYDTPMLISRHLADSLRPYNCQPAEGFSYGLFEVRVRQPKYAGSFPAFWLFGGIPDEIDVFEANADAFMNNFHLGAHDYWRPSRRQSQDCQCMFYNTDPTGNLHEQYHTYGVSWLPTGVVFYYDGIPIRHETRLIPQGCAMAVIVNMGALDWSSHATDTLAVDYIRIYRPHQLPKIGAVERPGARSPQSEMFWVPSSTQPGLPDQGTHQTWRLAPPVSKSFRLDLQLTDNYNSVCDLYLPLPVAGRWAPTWTQTYGTPELRVLTPAPDSLHWVVRDAFGQFAGGGTAAGGGTWRPDMTALPPGTYALHLRQGTAATVQHLNIIGRPANSGPDAAWQQPAPVAPEAEPIEPLAPGD